MIGGDEKQWRMMAVVFFVGVVTTGLIGLGVVGGLLWLLVRGMISLL